MLKKKSIYKSFRGVVLEENIVALGFLFLFIFFPLSDLVTMAMGTFMLWFACEQGAMAGAKGTVWSTNSYSGYYSCIQTQAMNQANTVAATYTGVQVTSGPTLTVIAEGIPNTAGATINPYTPTLGTSLDKSLYVPMLQVSMTGTIKPFIVIPFIPIKIPGLNAPFSTSVNSQQQIENITALSY